MLNNSPPFENRAVYGIMWKDTVQPDRPQITIWRMRTAYLIPKVTVTFRICISYHFYSAAMVARMLYCAYIAYLVKTLKQNQCRL